MKLNLKNRTIESGSLSKAALVAGVVALSGTLYATAYSQYAIYTLPKWNDGTFSRARAINESGNVAGYGDITGGHFRGIFWDVSYNSVITSSSMATVIPMLGGNNTAFFGINDNNQLAGYREKFNPLQGLQKKVAWSGIIGSTSYNLGNFSASDSFESAANDVNNNGVVTGWSQGFGGSTSNRGFKYDTQAGSPSMVSIGVLSGGTLGWSSGSAINSFGTIVGYAPNTNGADRAIRFGASLTDLGGYLALIFEDPYETFATCLNDGVNVGGYSQLDFNTNRAIYRTPLMSLGSWNPVPLLSGVGSDPADDSNVIYGVNSSSDYVGASEIGNTNNRAFLYRNDGGGNYSLHNLNNFLPVNSGWVLNTAYDINDRGWIVGDGVLNSQTRGFILYPYTILSGQISSTNWDPTTLGGRTMDYEIRDASTNQVLQSSYVFLSSNGTYSINTTWCKNIILSVDVQGPFLRKNATINATNNIVTNFNIISGDADDDNAITPSDYGIWALNNGSFGFPGVNGDFDGDGAVTPSDYGLWQINNGTLGDD